MDDVIDAGDLLLVDDRPELDIFAIGVAGPQALRLLGQGARVVGGESAVDEVTAGGEADLALELEGRERAGRSRSIQVGIVEDDE